MDEGPQKKQTKQPPFNFNKPRMHLMLPTSHSMPERLFEKESLFVLLMVEVFFFLRHTFLLPSPSKCFYHQPSAPNTCFYVRQHTLQSALPCTHPSPYQGPFVGIAMQGMVLEVVACVIKLNVCCYVHVLVNFLSLDIQSNQAVCIGVKRSFNSLRYVVTTVCAF